MKKNVLPKMLLKNLRSDKDEPSNLIMNKTGGYLLRSKFAKAKEGGIAIGTAALDSIILSDE